MQTEMPPNPQNSRQQAPSLFMQMTLAIALLALLVSGWLWYQTRQNMQEMQAALSLRISEFQSISQRSLALAQNADARSSDMAARAAVLDQKLAASLDQQEALQALYIELSHNREERILSEVEQLMIIAQQQLELAVQVKPALIALQNADSRLQILESLQAVQLRKSLNQDIQRLQQLELPDIIGMNLKLEQLALTLESLTLASDRVPGQVQPSTQQDPNTWRRLVREIWQELKGMIQLERLDQSTPPLLPPEQRFFLRENIRLRLLGARLALLQRDESTFLREIETAKNWLTQFYDAKDPRTRYILAQLDGLSKSAISVTLPDLRESMNQLAKYKLSLLQTSDSGRKATESRLADPAEASLPARQQANNKPHKK